MKQVIWKFPLMVSLANPVVIAMPKDAKILTLELQAEATRPGAAWTGTPTIWAIFPDENEAVLVERTFEVVGTGQVIEPRAGKRSRYVGTWQTAGGFVWHLFEWVEF